MDRFVWFVLLVVISHLATEFTRATGYTRGPRPDVVAINDFSIQPIKLQNQVFHPGQEYGLYGQPNHQYHNVSNLYNNYANNENYESPSNNVNKSNFLSSLLNRFANSNINQNEQEHSHMPNSVNSNNLLSLPPSGQGSDKTFSFRPLIDSIFEIPISTLRAVNELVRRLTGGYLQPQQQNQQHPIKYSFSPSHATSNSYYSMYRAADAIQPKKEFEILNRKHPTAEAITVLATATPPNISFQPTTIRRPSHNVSPQS